MTVKIEKSTPRGVIAAPPAKSFAHRQIICAALCNGQSVIYGAGNGDDVIATLDCVRSLGADVFAENGKIFIQGLTDIKKRELFCRESGSTLRFLIPVCLALGGEFTFYGSKTLMSRPLGAYEKLCADHNIELKKGSDSLYINGKLECDELSVDGSVSSQFITGLMLAAPLMSEKTVIRIEPPFYSKPYVDITAAVMSDFGVTVNRPDNLTAEVAKSGGYKSRICRVEGDCSNAAFLDALGAFGDVTVTGLNENTVQGDAVYKEFFKKIKDGFAVLDIADCPDLAPVLLALGAAFHGVKLINTSRLKTKESDRGAAMKEELFKFGVPVTTEENSITVDKSKLRSPDAPLFAHNDHRVAMACAVLLTLTGGVIEGAQAVNKSYPDFFSDLQKLGVNVNYETDA